MSTKAQTEEWLKNNQPSDHLAPVAAEGAEPKPTVGRIVHYVVPTGPNAGAHRPALVIVPTAGTVQDTEPGFVDLVAFLHPDDNRRTNGIPMLWPTRVPYDATGEERGSWHWPERV